MTIETLQLHALIIATEATADDDTTAINIDTAEERQERAEIDAILQEVGITC